MALKFSKSLHRCAVASRHRSVHVEERRVRRLLSLAQAINNSIWKRPRSRNACFRGLARSATVEVDADLVAQRDSDAPDESPVNLLEMERQHILSVLTRTHWRVYGPHGAAAQLGLNPSTLRSRLKKLGLSRPTKQLIF